MKRGEERVKDKRVTNMLGRIKFCPRCGSTNIFWASGLPQLWSLWECRECGYRGALILEDGEIAEKLRLEWRKRDINH